MTLNPFRVIPQSIAEWNRWIRDQDAAVTSAILTVSTTTLLADVTASINTSANKKEGYHVFNATTNKPVWAVGSADADVWVNATGSTEHTPA